MLEVRRIKKKYSSKEYVLENVEFSIEMGKCLFIRGVSGSGKTTLLNIIGLLDNPDEGEILFNNENILLQDDNYRNIYRNEKIGIVFQKYNLLLSLTVLENILIPVLYRKFSEKKSFEERAKKILKSLNMESFIHRKVMDLSGGQQQRVAIARVLLQDPTIILADEPTANVDVETEKLVLELLRNCKKQGKIVIIVSHNDIYKNIADYEFHLKRIE